MFYHNIASTVCGNVFQSTHIHCIAAPCLFFLKILNKKIKFAKEICVFMGNPGLPRQDPGPGLGLKTRVAGTRVLVLRSLHIGHAPPCGIFLKKDPFPKN
jgi:hypothetical protein